ncbi:carbohydrate porin [Cerasicoccus arenae]|uniref:Porin n=1 Tax=Cerasicoccus arenae TaxID=424488 RepID=A0A8J3GCY1_9BACT|nr:carbohydrate porin [Cerasicoccus arenae]MBK1857177.1 carbohydrate porin [Cerasicoccus arenae]GHB92798.1 porin [Cerasicoccus arenae]
MKNFIAWRPLRRVSLLCLISAVSPAFAAYTQYAATAEERHDEMMTYFDDHIEPTIPDSLDTWWSYKYMLGDGYYRDDLAKEGITLSLKFVTDSMGNVSGGARQGFTYTGSMGFDMDADLERLVGIPGADFYVSAVWRSGVSLSNRYIHNVFQTQQVYGGQNLRLYAFYWRQELFEDQLEVKLGRIAQGDDFLSRPIYWSYVQNAFDGNPVSIFLNSPMYAYPNATWGAFFKYTPKQAPVYAQVGVYGGAKKPAQNRNSAHGLDWSFDYENIFIIGQAGWTPELTIGNQEGLPGNYSMGGYHVIDDHPTFLQPPTIAGLPKTVRKADGLWGMYWMVDQMVYSNGVNSSGNKTGITPWFTVSLAPDERVNKMPLSFYGGIRFDAVLPSRKDDFLALGYVYGKFSDDFRKSQVIAGLSPQNFESVVELTYMIQVNQWLTFQPDIQYIINPGAAGKFGDALVLGFQSSVQF